MTEEEIFERASELARTLVTLAFEDDDDGALEGRALRRRIVRIVKGEPEAVLAQMFRIFALTVRDVYDDQREFQQYMLQTALDDEED